jgi:hypothetical protein
MKLAVMRFLAHREVLTTFKEAICCNCSWSINTRQTAHVTNLAREHTQETGHIVEVKSERTTTYYPDLKE